MQDELERFDQECELILNSHIEDIETNLPDTIYHYTNSVGLKGIIESGKFHFTNIWKLNDPSELEHGCAPAKMFINDFLN